MKVSLIISTYNWPEALEMSLYSLTQQLVLPYEAIIADDGSSIATTNVINRMAELLPIPIKHVWQEDKGFRKSLILNKAVKAAEGDYIIQIDGDIYMERHFIKDHISVMRKNRFVCGRRALLLQEGTKICLQKFKDGIFNYADILENVYKKSRCFRNFMYYLLFSGKKDVLKILGCNMAYWKSDFIKINGYNNEMEGWGYEDTDLAARLVNAGVKLQRMKFYGIAIHLWHQESSRHNEKINHDLTFDMINKEWSVVKNGYNQSLFENISVR